jgi:IMP cyclohydrolase
MQIPTQEVSAAKNMQDLSQNPYPGRGIVVGLDESAQYIVQIYWIMGRSENSRNRVFDVDNETGRLYTEPADSTKVSDPSLIIYNAMRENGGYYVVSNGDQTNTVMVDIGREGPFSLQKALYSREYEPDGPNFTQRITAVSKLTRGRPLLSMSILRKSEFGEECDRITYNLNPKPGFGYCITTYASDGNPLPPFRGDPLVMPLMGNTEDIIKAYWEALDTENRVSIAVKVIEIGNGRSDTYIINKNTTVAK